MSWNLITSFELFFNFDRRIFWGFLRAEKIHWEHAMYRFVRDQNCSDRDPPSSPFSTQQSSESPPYGSTNRLYVLGGGNGTNSGAPQLNSMYQSQPNLSPRRPVPPPVERRVKEIKSHVVTISVNGGRDGDSGTICDQSSDTVTRIFVNESPGFAAIRDYGLARKSAGFDGMKSSGDFLDSLAEQSNEELQFAKSSSSRHKLVKRRRNITEEETVTVTRRIRRVKGRSLVLEGDEQEVPVDRRVFFAMSKLKYYSFIWHFFRLEY